MPTKKITSAPLKVVTMGELLDRKFPRREHLLAPWLRQGESVMVWAAAGLGKTMLTLTMALAVAGRGEFLGWRNDTPRRVLVIDGEMHMEDLKDRLVMLAPTVAGLNLEEARANLRVVARQDQTADAKFPDLAATDGQAAVLGMISEHTADLVVLDNFATLAEVVDENEAAAMSPVLSFLLRLKQTGVACILVHHSGKTGGTYRGSSKLATTFEVILGLKQHDEAVVGAGATFETEWTKFRGEPHPAVRAAVVRLENGDKGHQWASVAAEGDSIRQMLDLLRSMTFSDQKGIASAMGVPGGTVSRWKSRAIREGRVTDAEWRECLTTAYAESPTAAF